MQNYLWEIHFQSDIGVQSVKVVSSKQNLGSINKSFEIALVETGFDDSRCMEIIKVEYLDEVYMQGGNQ
ncbi:hypothetical protein GCM10008931_44240 [Oceanobacillus oncorhynchi subsp. oncorhynchi]|uniref:hypothetical protein n=1 Tax=Oceanobacillus oncorhynchi TaxID=545501 RepID=UPI0031E32F61